MRFIRLFCMLALASLAMPQQPPTQGEMLWRIEQLEAQQKELRQEINAANIAVLKDQVQQLVGIAKFLLETIAAAIIGGLVAAYRQKRQNTSTSGKLDQLIAAMNTRRLREVLEKAESPETR